MAEGWCLNIVISEAKLNAKNNLPLKFSTAVAVRGTGQHQRLPVQRQPTGQRRRQDIPIFLEDQK